MATLTIGATPRSSFADFEAVVRLAHYSRDVLHLSRTAIADDLRRFNDRNGLGLSTTFLDELARAVVRAGA